MNKKQKKGLMLKGRINHGPLFVGGLLGYITKVLDKQGMEHGFISINISPLKWSISYQMQFQVEENT